MKLGIQLHTAEPLVPEAYALKFDLAIEKLKSHEAPRINQIPAELLKVGVEYFALRFTNVLILFAKKREII